MYLYILTRATAVRTGSHTKIQTSSCECALDRGQKVPFSHELSHITTDILINTFDRLSSLLGRSWTCLRILTMRNMTLRSSRVELSRAVGTLDVVRVLCRRGRREVGKVTPAVLNLCHLLCITDSVDKTFMLTSPVTLLWLKMDEKIRIFYA